MRVFPSPSYLVDLIDQELGPSDWMVVSQDMIDRFADLTGDRQWIHVEPVRAAIEAPGGVTIAHGFLMLSLLPPLQDQLYRIEKVDHALNYGSDRLRFVSSTPAGSRIRLLQKIVKVNPLPNHGFRVFFHSTIEIEDSDRPALVVDTIALIFEAVAAT
ncbi:possible acyl dehydratase [Sphingobium indicum BiD32]|uniref:Possible acyl dehydratase n=1 Tax=Sphingobium indicum BiD32 TaxID=1301087 RepID=N1MIN2_9SPHN|nr:MaoC family dehydratase [Sphingobium indicum]CCW17090.1 possible acyl dehydratase [Sphingobium indicum BiD32]